MSTTEAPIDTDLQKRLVFAWLDALRSGEWKQGKQYLERGGKCCCLGVACRVIQRQSPDRVQVKIREDASVTFTIDDLEAVRWLPPTACALLGLKFSGGEYRDRSLIVDNDSSKPFPEIADIIEANARTLFVNGDEVAGWLEARRKT